ALHPPRHWPDLISDARAEHQIGKDCETVYADEHGTVTNPGCLYSLPRPRAEARHPRRRLNEALSILRHAMPENWRSVRNEARKCSYLPRTSENSGHESTRLD